MQSILITGATSEDREQKVKTFINSSISEFNITTLKADSLGINDIRRLIHFIALKPISGDRKFAILHEAQALTLEAQNSLLKTLEEPPENTTIILTCPNNQLLLPTIVSRCQVINLQPTTYNLQPTTYNLMNSQFSTLINGGVGDRLKLAQDFSKTKEDALNWLEKMIIYSRQELITNITNNTSNNNNLTIEQLLSSLIALQKTHAELKTTNVNPRLALENLFLNL